MRHDSVAADAGTASTSAVDTTTIEPSIITPRRVARRVRIVHAHRRTSHVARRQPAVPVTAELVARTVSISAWNEGQTVDASMPVAR